MIILDTDVLSVVQRGEEPEYDRLARKLDAAAGEVAVSIVSFEEQMRGWLAYIAKAIGKLTHGPAHPAHP